MLDPMLDRPHMPLAHGGGAHSHNVCKKRLRDKSMVHGALSLGEHMHQTRQRRRSSCSLGRRWKTRVGEKHGTSQKTCSRPAFSGKIFMVRGHIAVRWRRRRSARLASEPSRGFVRPRDHAPQAQQSGQTCGPPARVTCAAPRVAWSPSPTHTIAGSCPKPRGEVGKALLV